MKREWKKKVVIAGVSLAVCFTFAGCGAQTDTNRGSYSGEIHAYAREEGSGTRAEFEQLIGTTEAGAKELALSTQEIVGQSCVPVHKTTSFLSDKSSGTLTIRGSSSIAPLMEQLAQDYNSYNPNVNITVLSTDSGDGLTAAIRGECDLAMSSRSLKDYETELLTTETIGLDAIVLIVNGQNPISDLTSKEIRNIYDGKVKDWSEL